VCGLKPLITHGDQATRETFALRRGGYLSQQITDDRTAAMTHETEVLTGEAGREVAETAALLLFVGSGIGAVLFFCVFAGGGVPLTALLGVAALAGLTGSVYSLHRLGRHATRDDRQH
jgi:hypothetical protein